MILRHISVVRWAVSLLLAAGLSFPAAAGAAVNLEISPNNVDSEYAGNITVNVTGLANGQSVRVETFLDFDGNGDVDSGDLMVQSFTVTDGQALSVAGERNSNVPGDEDGSGNGRIRAVLTYRALAEASRVAAKYVYRASAATGNFTAVTAAFTATQPVYPQKVTGKVTSGGSPVPSAFVVLIDPAADGPTGIVLSDASGKFTVMAEAGDYALGVLKSGFVFDFNDAPQVSIGAGQSVTQNVSLLAANRTISGRLTDEDTGAGLPGVQVEPGFADNIATLALTDADGNFTIPVSTVTSNWGIWVSYRSAALLGYVTLGSDFPVDIGGGNVSGVAIELPKATALIYGILENEQMLPLAGIAFDVSNDGYEVFGITDGDGRYVAGVNGGSWRVGPEDSDLRELGYVSPGAWVTVADGEARRQDLTAQRGTIRLSGRVRDDHGEAVEHICVYAGATQGGGGLDGQTDADGYFSLLVSEGSWSIGLCDGDARQRGLLGPHLFFSNVTQDVPNIDYIAMRTTARIDGWIRDGANDPVGGVWVYAWIGADGLSYQSAQETEPDGTFSLPVFNGVWQVGTNCGDLQARGYSCVDNQDVSVSGANGTAHFTVHAAPPPASPTSTWTTTPTQSATPTLTPTPVPCIGDCSGDGAVGVDELLRGIRVALGLAGLGDCPGFDCNGSGSVTVDCLVRAVLAATRSCRANP